MRADGLAPSDILEELSINVMDVELLALDIKELPAAWAHLPTQLVCFDMEAFMGVDLFDDIAFEIEGGGFWTSMVNDVFATTSPHSCRPRRILPSRLTGRLG